MNKLPKFIRTLIVLIFWVVVWGVVAVWVDKEVLVSSPIDVAKRFFELAQTPVFYTTILFSVYRIVTGFIIAVTIGVLFGILSAKVSLINELISPLLSIIKATPVASFIILALVWLDKQMIPSFISFLMVFPIMYSNIYEGIKNTPMELIEMTRIYHFRFIHKVTKLYIPALYPYFMAGFKTSLGLAWKAGVAAEVLCFPKYSIGKELYEAKTYLQTIDVFTWTLTIIMISVIIEKVLLWSVERFTRKEDDLYDPN